MGFGPLAIEGCGFGCRPRFLGRDLFSAQGQIFADDDADEDKGKSQVGGNCRRLAQKQDGERHAEHRFGGKEQRRLGRINACLLYTSGYGAGYLAAIVGQKKAREIWYLCRQYTADEALEMGLVNKVVPFDDLEDECMAWAAEMMQFSPTALRFMKASFNAATDGLAGLQQLAGDATLLYYTTDEAKEGRDAFKEKRAPDFTQFPKFP